MSKTPETDRETYAVSKTDIGFKVTPVSCAQRLERERNELRERCARIEAETIERCAKECESWPYAMIPESNGIVLECDQCAALIRALNQSAAAQCCPERVKGDVAPDTAPAAPTIPAKPGVHGPLQWKPELNAYVGGGGAAPGSSPGIGGGGTSLAYGIWETRGGSLREAELAGMERAAKICWERGKNIDFAIGVGCLDAMACYSLVNLIRAEVERMRREASQN
jgi:hypothetical protein